MSASQIERYTCFFPTSNSSAVWTVVLSIGLAVFAAIFCCFRRLNRQKSLYVRLPGSKVNGFIATLVPLMSIYKNKAASNRALLFQVICGYCHVFRKEGMWLFHGGHKKILLLFKAETVEPVLNSNEILSKGFEYEFVQPMLKEGLLTSKRDKWRHRRKLLTPAFHFRTLDEYIPIFNEQANIFTQKIAACMETEACINISSYTSLCTLDIICETAMGKKINVQETETSPYVEALHDFCAAAPNRIMNPLLWPDFIYYRTKEGRHFKKCLQVMDEFTRNVVAERKAVKLQEMMDHIPNTGLADPDDIGQRSRKRLALLDLLLDVHLRDETFTLEDVAEEVDNFMFAGHDTTSSGLSFAMYMLGLHPEIQQRAQQEVDDVWGEDADHDVTLDDIKELKYLDCVLKETRRLWPPTPFIARDLDEDAVINGYVIPRGTSCGILIHMLHRDPAVFHRPEVFDPDRFTLANSAGRHPFAYVPFSAGPRNCIGQRFAVFEAITVLAIILRKFDLKSEDPLDKIQIVDDLILRSENGLRMSFKRRLVS